LTPEELEQYREKEREKEAAIIKNNKVKTTGEEKFLIRFCRVKERKDTPMN